MMVRHRQGSEIASKIVTNETLSFSRSTRAASRTNNGAKINVANTKIFHTTAALNAPPNAPTGFVSQDLQATVRQSSKDAGLFDLTQPVEFGGSHAGPVELAILQETLAAANSPLKIFGPDVNRLPTQCIPDRD